jgi:hypothetical protein
MREILAFEPNVPVEVALEYPAGKPIQTEYGQRVMFSLANGNVMFLDLGTSQKINELRPKVGEPFYICKHHSGKKTDRAEWRVFRREGAEAAVRAAASPKAAQPAAAGGNHTTNGSNGNGHAASAPAQIHVGWAQFLLQQTNGLIDVYAAAVAYAKTKQGASVSAADVLELLTAAYAAQTKRGGPDVA